MADIITSDPNPQDTNLTAYIQVILHANFSRIDTSYTDDPVVNLNYQNIKHLLSQGSLENQADLFYHSLSTYIGPLGVQTYNLDNNTLKDIYGKPLNFSTVRLLIIKNNANLFYITFKNLFVFNNNNFILFNCFNLIFSLLCIIYLF